MKKQTINDNQLFEETQVKTHPLLGLLLVILLGVIMAAMPWMNAGRFAGLPTGVRLLGSIIFVTVYAKATWEFLYKPQQ